MKLEEAIIIIKKLKLNLDKWSFEYYQKDNPTVDDSLYDESLKELNKLENKFPSLITTDSPTQKIGYFKNSLFNKVAHKIPMQSLKNAFSNDDLKDFDNKIKSLTNEYSFTVEPKIDGLSISLYYKNNHLIRAVTRGDGEIGEDITNNVLQINNIPKKINNKDAIEVRGEIFLPLTEFNRVNNERFINGDNLFANPRNAASGTMRQLSSKVVGERNMDAIMYWCINADTLKYKWSTQTQTLNNLSKMGFKTFDLYKKSKTIDEVIKSINEILDARDSFDYEIDGIVIKINESNLYENIGYTSKFPKWAVAYKFPAEIKETELISIFQTVGRTGRITYNAELFPIELSGSIIKRATLHNAEYIRDLDLRLNDIVRIKKAGEIIPKVISVNKEKRFHNNPKWVEDKFCKSCGTKLERAYLEVDQYCNNENCDAKLKESIIHFCSRDAMNIEGLSIKQIERFIDIGYISNFSDIYDLWTKKEEIINLDGYQEKSVNSLINSINKSKEVNLEKLIFALGIRHIGKKSSKDLAIIFKNINDIMDITIDELELESDFGEVKSNSLVNYFSNKKNIFEINKLISKGINTSQKILKINKDNKFFGKTVVITGSIKGFKREDVKNYLFSLGAKVTINISSNTDYLIFGDKGSEKKASKVDKNKIINVQNIKDLGV